MSDDAPRRGASFSSAFLIILSLARERIAELGCPPVGENAKAFVDRGGLSSLETKAAEVAIRRVREAAYPLIFKLFGSEMPRGKERKFVLTRLGQDLARIEYLDIDSGPRGTICASITIGITVSAARRPNTERNKASLSLQDSGLPAMADCLCSPLIGWA
jgi:hypothetical protein